MAQKSTDMISEAEKVPEEVRRLINELRTSPPVQGEEYKDFESGEEPVYDNPYIPRQPGVDVIRAFQKHPDFSKEKMETFRGALSQVHSNTFYKEEDMNVLLHGFELLTLFSEFETPPDQITFKRDVENENIRMDFYGRCRQSIGDTVERRNNRVLLSAQVTNLPTDERAGKSKLFLPGGQKR